MTMIPHKPNSLIGKRERKKEKRKKGISAMEYDN